MKSQLLPLQVSLQKRWAPILLILLAAASIASAHTVIIHEAFSGAAGTPLNGKSADLFAAAIVEAGGHGQWVALEGATVNFLADGSVQNSAIRNQKTYLTLGSYVNDSMGTDRGHFILTTRFTDIESAWLSAGFFIGEGLNPDGNTVTSNSGVGMATVVQRKGNGDNNFYAGPRVEHPFTLPGPELAIIKIEIDFTPASGYNGIDHFGIARIYDPNDLATMLFHHTYTSKVDISAIGFSVSNPATGGADKIVFLELAQIPEAKTSAIGLGIIALFVTSFCRQIRRSQ